MIKKPRLLPTFEEWVESTASYNIGSDIKFSTDIEMSGWDFDVCGLDRISKESPLRPEDMVRVPAGDYKVKDQDFDYVLLSVVNNGIDDTTGLVTPSYIVKAGDFETMKNRIKNN